MADSASRAAFSAPNRTLFYRKALTPLLHRRFVSSAGALLVLSWVTATLTGSWNSLIWTWFPLGPTGIRTLLLFCCGIAVYIERVANMHFGQRNLPSIFDAIRELGASLRTIYTFSAYLASAALFAEIYRHSAPSSADLAWVTEGRLYERTQLNEKPVFMRAHLFLLALYQITTQLVCDRHRVRLPQAKPITQASAFYAPSIQPTRIQQVLEQATTTVQSAARRAAISFPINWILYPMLIKPWAWSWTLLVAKTLRHDISMASEPSSAPPYHYKVIWHSLIAGTLLVIFWDVCNLLFDVYLAQPPLKSDAPLTASCKVPNGNLINGLSSKKELVKTFAFWELMIISQSFEDRRKAIFEDLNINGASAWSQILKSSLDVLEDINTRITDKKAPPPETTLVHGQNAPPHGLPQLSAPLKQGAVLSPSRPADWQSRNALRARELVKSFGQTPDAGSPLKTLAISARDKALTQEQQDQLTYSSLKLKCIQLAQYLLKVRYLGVPFRQTFASRSSSKVLGTPTSEKEVILRAIDSMSCLAVASIKDDRYGIVHKDIQLIVRTLVNISSAIEQYIRQSPIHWTDVEFEESKPDARKVPEIEEVLEHLRSSLAFLLGSFSDHAADMGLGPIEMREARKAAGLGSS